MKLNLMTILSAIFLSLEAGAITLHVNGQKVDPRTYKLKIGDKVKLDCSAKKNAQGEPAFAQSIILYGEHDRSSPFVENAAALEMTISPNDGKKYGALSFQCWVSSKENLEDPYKQVHESISINTETPREFATTGPEVKSMTLSINGEKFRLTNHHLLNRKVKPGDKLALTCEADHRGRDSAYSTSRIRRDNNSTSRSYLHSSTAETIVAAEDGQKTGQIELSCETSDESNRSDTARQKFWTAGVPTETQRVLAVNPPSVGAARVDVETPANVERP